MLSTHLKILNQNISRRRQMASFRVKPNAKRCDLSTHLKTFGIKMFQDVVKRHLFELSLTPKDAICRRILQI